MAISAQHTYSFEDFLTLVRARRATSMFGVKTRYAVWLAGFLTVLIWFSPGLLDPGTWRLGAVWAIVLGWIGAMIAILFVIDLFFDHVLYRLHYRRLATAGAEVKLVLDEHGMTWTVAQMSGLLPWSAVKRVIERREGLVAFIGSIEGIVIPARAFASAEDYAAARTLIREKTHDTA